MPSGRVAAAPTFFHSIVAGQLLREDHDALEEAVHVGGREVLEPTPGVLGEREAEEGRCASS